METGAQKSKDSKSRDMGILCPRVRAKYVTDMYRESKWKQFLNMKQRNLYVAEYEKEFSHLSKYALKAVLTEAFRCRQFEDGLHDSIKRYLAPVTFPPVGELLLVGPSCNESGETRNQQQRKVSKEEVLKRSLLLLW